MVRTSSPSARARAPSAIRPIGVMTKASAARTSSAANPPSGRRRHPDETPATLTFEGQRIVGAQRQHSVPRLCRRDQGQRAILADLSDKVAGTPQPTSRIVTTLRLNLVEVLAA